MTTGAARYLEFPDLNAAGDAVAVAIAAALSEEVAINATASLVLAGGSTPRVVYERLADPRGRSLPWDGVHLFWGDERCVPPEDDASNYLMARRTLIDRVAVPPANVHRIRGELPPEEAAARYDAELRRYATEDERPDFDVVLLGMGADGHTASLFPGDPLLDEDSAWVGVADGRRASPPVPRVSLSLGTINSARRVLFLVAGADKLAVVDCIRSRAPGSDRYPAARIRPAGSLEWFLARR